MKWLEIGFGWRYKTPAGKNCIRLSFKEGLKDFSRQVYVVKRGVNEVPPYVLLMPDNPEAMKNRALIVEEKTLVDDLEGEAVFKEDLAKIQAEIAVERSQK